MSKIVLVVPTNRKQRILEFLDAWRPLPRTIIVEDNPTKTFNLGTQVDHYSWEDIDKELGEDAWIIPRRTAGIRSFGFLKAAQVGADIIVTLDDDCLPIGDRPRPHYFFRTHERVLESRLEFPVWFSTVGGPPPRGVPYYSDCRSWPTVVNAGLWEGVPDYDAPTQLLQQRNKQGCELLGGVAPVGLYVPISSMNLAFKVEVLPAMYFLLMGRDYMFDRFEDIWSGILVKRICDHLRLSIRYGRPYVHHSKASNVFTNLQKEATGLEANEYFWEAVDDIILRATTVAGCYEQLALELPLRLKGAYWKELSKAMLVWLKLVEERCK